MVLGLGFFPTKSNQPLGLPTMGRGARKGFRV